MQGAVLQRGSELDVIIQNKTLKSKAQTNSKIFSIINLEAVTAKKVAINITELKIMINSIREDKIISFFENPKILNTKF